MSDTDKPELRRANDNPWYCLATMHGEQPIDEWDDDLADKNRLAWNRWIATALPDPERLKLPKSGFPESDLTPLAPEEKLDFCRAFAVRTRGETRTPPELAAFCDLSSTDFDRLVDFRGFLFAAHMDFSWSNFRVGLDCSAATFQHSTDFGMATIKSAGFESATFYKHCSFIETKIGGGYFESAKFKDAYFH